MSKGKGSTTTVQKSDPWIGQQPFLRRGFREAGSFLDQPAESLVAGFDPAQQQALGLMEQRALSGNQLLPQAQGEIGSTLAGDYMFGPGMDRITDYVMSSVRPNVDASFASGGRYGSGLHAESLGRGVARGLTPFIDAERNRMMQAAFGAPGLAAADYQDPQQLFNVGGMRQGQQQTELDAAYNQLRKYMGVVGGGNFGGQTTTTQPMQGSSPLLGAAGGAAAGAGLGSMMAAEGATGLAALGGPWPLLIGGGLGLLGSL